MGEVNHFVAFVSDRHACDDGVIVARDKIWDDRIPVIGDPLAVQLGALAELIS